MVNHPNRNRRAALESEVKWLRDTLRPFARFAEENKASVPESAEVLPGLTMGDFYAALDAVSRE